MSIHRKSWAAFGAAVLVLGLFSFSAQGHAVCPNSYEHQHFGSANNVVASSGADPGDCYFMGAGDDSYTGLSNDSRIDGEADGDLLIGNGGSDRLIGGSGPDELRGGTGWDDLIGNGANDDLHAGGDPSSVDSIYDGTGNDLVISGDVNDKLYRCEDGDADDFSQFDGGMYGPSTIYCDGP